MESYKLDPDECLAFTMDIVEQNGKNYKKLLWSACDKRGLDSEKHSVNISTGELKRVG